MLYLVRKLTCGASRPSLQREGLGGQAAVLQGEEGWLASGRPVVLKSTETGESEACGRWAPDLGCADQ